MDKVSVDINNANVKELQELSGVGPEEAQLIIDARQLKGSFNCIHDLSTIEGLNPDIIQSNLEILSCTPRPSRCGCFSNPVNSYLTSSSRHAICLNRIHNERNENRKTKENTPSTSSRAQADASCQNPESASSEHDGEASSHSKKCSATTKDAEISSIASSVRKLLRGSSSIDRDSLDRSEPVSENDMDSSGEEDEADLMVGEEFSSILNSGESKCHHGIMVKEDTCIASVIVSVPDKPLFQMKRKSDVVEAKLDNSIKKPCRTLEVFGLTVPAPTGDISLDSGIAEIEGDGEIIESSTTVTRILPVVERKLTTKMKPPPQLEDWLGLYQSWSNAERLFALDQLIEMCEPTQIRHMMSVIEPQFQRDFISLLPKELALYVLAFLEPRDLLRAAQTCRNWRVLAEDNLLWREKCREAGIEDVREVLGKRRIRNQLAVCAGAGNSVHAADLLIPSPWKAAYMMHHNIEMNWRHRPIRTPKVLKGHDDHVITCLQFSGNRIVSGSDDNTLKVWSASSGKCLRTLVGHTGGVWSSQMAGNIIISGSTDRTLKVWNADSGHCIHTLYGHTSTVRCMHLHGSRVVSGSRDATLRLWDIETGECLHVLVGHVAAVRCVQYNGKLVVSGAYDYMVKVWNPEREECLHTLQGHTNRVYSLQFDGVHVVSGSLDTSIRVWDVETGSCKHMLMGHQSLTSGMELRNNILVSGNADSTVKVWDILTGQCLQTLAGSHKHQSAVTCLQFNSKFVITSSDDGTVKLWDLRTGEFIRNLVALESGGSGGVVWRIRASATKLVCAVGSRNGTEETKLVVLDFDVEQK